MNEHSFNASHVDCPWRGHIELFVDEVSVGVSRVSTCDDFDAFCVRVQELRSVGLSVLQWKNPESSVGCRVFAECANHPEKWLVSLTGTTDTWEELHEV